MRGDLLDLRLSWAGVGVGVNLLAPGLCLCRTPLSSVKRNLILIGANCRTVKVAGGEKHPVLRATDTRFLKLERVKPVPAVV